MNATEDTLAMHRRLCALLDEHKAQYRVMTHEAEGRTELIAKIRGNRVEQAIKSIVVMIRFGKKETRYCLANVPGDCRIDLPAVRDHFGGTKSAFAPREKAEELTGCVIGAIPPFSFNPNLPVLADPLIRENSEVVFNAGSLERSIFMQSEDYFRIANPQVVQVALRG